MQMKSSYGVLKWTFLAGVVASMATACVVSSGDGDDDGIGEGGDSGSSSKSGSKATGGGGNNTGGTSAGTSDGGTPTMTDGGTPTMTDGGMPGSTFVPGECQVDEPLTPASEPACDAVDGDSDCIKCVKLQACAEYKTCFGEEPATACSVGQTEGADGQFVCITKCFAANTEGIFDEGELLDDCASKCDECGTGGVNDETTDIITQANKANTCQAECFPFE